MLRAKKINFVLSFNYKCPIYTYVDFNNITELKNIMNGSDIADRIFNQTADRITRLYYLDRFRVEVGSTDIEHFSKELFNDANDISIVNIKFKFVGSLKKIESENLDDVINNLTSIGLNVKEISGLNEVSPRTECLLRKVKTFDVEYAFIPDGE